MRVFVTGATGFLGRALVARLRSDGHEVVAWVRAPERARSVLGPDVALTDASLGEDALAAALNPVDAVFNLAGEPLLGGRWTDARRRVLVTSRTETTRRIVDALAAVSRRPRVLVSASAVGYYGDTGDAPIDETAPAGQGFLAEICALWEEAAERAANDATRVAILRLGVALGEGGALESMRLPFQLGVGGHIGSGRQWMSWVHVDDLVAMWMAALGDERFVGPWNATAPEPVTNREFVRALGAAMHRPAVVPVPALALKALYGGGASVVLEGQRVLPARLSEVGFEWEYRTVEAALAAIVSRRSYSSDR